MVRLSDLPDVEAAHRVAKVCEPFSLERIPVKLPESSATVTPMAATLVRIAHPALRRVRMSRRVIPRVVVYLLVPLLWTGCHVDDDAHEAASEPSLAKAVETYAAYVLLVASPEGATVPFARLVTDAGVACPSLDEPGAGQLAEPIGTIPRENPHGFEVQVCEAAIPFDTELAVVGGSARLPRVKRRVDRVAVLGDTGCKPDKQDGCVPGSAAWPLATFAAAAAGGEPDLVLHMGDFNYRGTSSHYQGTGNGQPVEGEWTYDAGDGAPASEKCELDTAYYSQNSSGSTDPDAWDAWRLDFFEPAAPLLGAAPWVVARGNHELCSRAGPGWLYFLGPSSELPEGGGEQVACPSQELTPARTEGDPGQPPAVLQHLVFVPPYTVRLGDLAVSVLDTANACDAQPNFVDRYRRQFAELAAQDAGAGTHWLIMHRPLWGADSPASDPGYACDGSLATGTQQNYSVINRTLECAVEGEVGGTLLPELDLALAGHMHRFEWLEFGGGSRPPMLIVGNSGVELNEDTPNGAFSQLVDGQPASGFGLDQFGYVELLRREGEGGEPSWHGEVVAQDSAAWSGLLPPCGSQAGAGKFLCVRGLPAASSSGQPAQQKE